MAEQDITFLRHTGLQVCQTFESLGGDIELMLREVDLTLDRLRQPEYRLPHTTLRQMLAHGTNATGREDFGLHVGNTVEPLTFASVGVSWLSSDTAWHGMQRMARFSELMVTGANPILTETDDTLEVCLNGEGMEFASPELVDMVAASMLRMTRLTVNHSAMPRRVDLLRPKPKDPEPWVEVFGRNIRWGADRTTCVWDKAPLTLLRLMANEELARSSDQRAEQLIRDLHRSELVRQVNRQIALRLPDGPPDQETIANDLAMSVRTLHRRLKEEGTTFNELLTHLRQSLAQRLLADGHHSVSEVAFNLGYTDHSAFSRAFKGWFGQSPNDYAKNPH